jgi:hypothetical protein
MLVDLDAWYKDQKKYEAEGNGDPASPLPGMVYRPKAAGEYKPMAWPAFRVFNMTKLHGPLFRVRLPRSPRGALLMTGDQIMLGANRFHAH